MSAQRDAIAQAVAAARDSHRLLSLSRTETTHEISCWCGLGWKNQPSALDEHITSEITAAVVAVLESVEDQA